MLAQHNQKNEGMENDQRKEGTCKIKTLFIVFFNIV